MNTTKYLKESQQLRNDSIVVEYRDIGDFDMASIRKIVVDDGITGWFGRLNRGAAPIDYGGELYALAFEFDDSKYTQETANEWVKQSDYKADLVTAKGIEIIKVGNWNGDEYTLEHLNSMVVAHEERVYNAGLKLGHNKTQKALKLFLDGMPRFGNCERLYIQNDTLIGDFKDIPKKLGKVLEAKAFPMKSAEIYFNFQHKGKMHDRVLKAIALFGDNVPACEGLSDVVEIYDQEEKVASSIDKVEYRVYDINGNKKPEEVNKMTEAEMKALEQAKADKEQVESLLKKSNDEVEKLKTENEVLRKAKDAEESKLKELREKETDAVIVKTVEGLLKSKIKSEAVGAFVSICKALSAREEKVSSYTLKDGVLVKGEEVFTLETFLKFVESIPENPEIVKMFTEGASNEGVANESGKSEDEILSDKVDAYLREHKLPKTTDNLKLAVENIK